MNSTAAISRSDDALKESAARLIGALGVEGAIFICRSNYWHGILRHIPKGDRRHRAAIG